MSGTSLQDHNVEELGLSGRCVAAGLAAVVSSVLVNPLEVVKTRMQADIAKRLLGNVHSETVQRSSVGPRLAVCGWPLELQISESGAYTEAFSSRSATGVLARITQKEGLRSLWRGLDAAMLLNLPLIAIYLPCYDYLESRVGHPHLGFYGPLVAGALARGIAVTATSPLELLKTRVQGSAQLLNAGAMLEPTRTALMTRYHLNGHEPDRLQIATANALAGSFAASFAAAITTPLDVVKTKLQTAPSTQHVAPGWGSMLWSLAKAGGLSALFTGTGLRSVRTGTAYGIMMASYEIAKNDMRHYFNAPSLLLGSQSWFDGNP